jgi:hypothetical protein
VLSAPRIEQGPSGCGAAGTVPRVLLLVFLLPDVHAEIGFDSSTFHTPSIIVLRLTPLFIDLEKPSLIAFGLTFCPKLNRYRYPSKFFSVLSLQHESQQFIDLETCSNCF